MILYTPLSLSVNKNPTPLLATNSVASTRILNLKQYSNPPPPFSTHYLTMSTTWTTKMCQISQKMTERSSVYWDERNLRATKDARNVSHGHLRRKRRPCGQVLLLCSSQHIRLRPGAVLAPASCLSPSIPDHTSRLFPRTPLGSRTGYWPDMLRQPWLN